MASLHGQDPTSPTWERDYSEEIGSASWSTSLGQAHNRLFPGCYLRKVSLSVG